MIKLEQNYRSTEKILEAANQVVKNNCNRKVKKLWTDLGEGEELGYHCSFDEQDEARFVAQRIGEWRDKGGSYNDVAVLYRTNGQSRTFEEWFRRLGIPYRIIGGLGFYERKEIKDVLSYLRLLANPSDAVGFERIINVPKRSIGDTSLGRLFQYMADNELNLAATLNSLEEVVGLPPKARDSMISFRALMNNLRAKIPMLSLTELVEELLEQTGYLAELKNSKDLQAQSRIENLQEFISVTKDYDRANPGGSLDDFLSGLALYTDLEDTELESQEQVKCMTLHTAKGLEFPLVFLVGMEEGIFPHSRSLESEEDMEEERRLCYVGITRAMQKLYLCHAQTRMLYGRSNHNSPSRFLKEVPPELLEGNGYPGNTQRRPGSLGKPKPIEEISEPALYILGEKVVHPKWGQGVVVSVTGQGGDAQVGIAFPGLGIKTLIAKYAPLKKVN